MHRISLINRLIDLLLADMPQYAAEAAQVPQQVPARRQLLRGLMNVRPPIPLQDAFLSLQDELLRAEREEKGVADGALLPPCALDKRLVLWQGDITRLKADAIVNAANSALLGCFVPGHRCIDNAIHSAAGLQLRRDCAALMARQGSEEPVGRAKITPGYNLPARYVLHTVGPQVWGPLTDAHRAQLAACYRACLELAAQYQLASVAFCCISTGEFHFPPPEAAAVAVRTVQETLPHCPSVQRVIFNVFQDSDARLYKELLR